MLAFSRDNLFDLRCGQNVYTCKEQTAVEGGKHKAYVHVFYHHEASGAQIDHYQRRLKEVKELFMQKKILTAEEQAFLYANYLTDKDSRELILNDNHEPILDTAVYNGFIKKASGLPFPTISKMPMSPIGPIPAASASKILSLRSKHACS